MNRFGHVELVFINQTNDADGNPVITEYKETVKCTLTDSFSLNYYQNQNRDMRRSKNIKVAKFSVLSRYIDGNYYQLEFANISGRRYKVANILLDRNTSLMSLLDLEEVMSE